MALLMLDLDNFKSVNDSLGHLAGDELLQQVANRLIDRLRNVDMIARLGGDEFTVLLENISHADDAAYVAADIISDLKKPFKLVIDPNHEVHIGVSIGISLYGQHGVTPQLLVDHADAALYKAKANGRNCFAYFSEDLTIAARKRIELEAILRLVIEREELLVYYQAQVDIATDKIIGAEALIRWQKPIEGLTSPAQFINFAEENGFIATIGAWILRETCRQGKQWLDAGIPPIVLAVNVSSHQFRHSDINSLVADVLKETGFPAHCLELELTESGLMDTLDNTRLILDNLRQLGIRLAIDDFGTGFSSLAYLKHFPINTLKIDKSFIDDIPYKQDDMVIAATIIAMGHILGFNVLAEGVETLEQLAFIREKGCDSYQGYLKSKPLPALQFEQLLLKQQ
jgi:diguanylate cyclase (GGDEF)-like protein